MIAKSDLVILAISGTLLATGIYRWQSNQLPAARLPAVVRAPVQQPDNSSQLTSARSPEATSATTTVSQTETPTTNSTIDSAETDDSGTVPSAPISDSVSNDDVTAPADSTEINADLYGTHIVESGDNLTYIADIHGTSVDTLRAINNIEGSLIYIDQKLLYPLPAN